MADNIRLIPKIILVLLLSLSASAATGTMAPAPRQTPPTATEPAPAPPAAPQAAVPDISLPMPRMSGQVSVEAVLAARGKVQNFQKNQLTLDQLGQLTFAVFGMPAGMDSASGSLIDPIGMYLVLDTGVYVYKPMERALGRVTKGDKRAFLAGVVSAIRPVSDAPCSIVITGKAMQSSGQVAGSREMTLVSAGRAAAAIEIQALAMGLGAVLCQRIGGPQVTDVLGLPQDEMSLCVIAVGYPLTGPVIAPTEDRRPGSSGPPVPGVLIVVPQKAIIDNEYDVVTSALTAAGFHITVASAETGTYRTNAGKEVQATVKLGEADVASYDAVVFLGGIEARQYYQDAAAKRVASDAFRMKKTLGALSTSPRILANTGILAGMRVAVNVTERQAIAREGAIVSSAEVEQAASPEGAIVVTATGARTAVQRFSQQLIEATRTTSSAARDKSPQPAEPAAEPAAR